PGILPEGIALYRSARTGSLHCFVTGDDRASGEKGLVEQWELRLDAAGERLLAARVRRFDVGGRIEGCACDDDAGSFFVSEEDGAVWRYGAAPDSGESRLEIERVGLFGRLRGDAEGIALYRGLDGGGYLIVSSQGSNDFTLYDRRHPY